MKIIASATILCLTLLLTNNSFCQDRKKTATESGSEFQDDEEDNETTNADSVSIRNKHTNKLILKVGIEGGYNEAGIWFNNNSNLNTISSWRIGAILDLKVYNKFYLQSGLFYAMNGTNDVVYNNGSEKHKWKISTLELPINLTLKFGHFFIGSGPFVGYNISGKITPNDINKGVLKIGSNSGDAIKAIDYGIGLNLGFQLNNGLLFRARYQRGLYNMQPPGNYITSSKYSTSFGFQIGYLFGKNLKHKRIKAKDDVYLDKKM